MKFVKTALLLVVFCTVTPCLSQDRLSVQDKLSVVSSIKPLSLVASDLIQGAGLENFVSVQVLLPVNVSPHHFALRVSDQAAVSKADLVLWIGPELEGFLAKVASRGIKLSLAEQQGIRWPAEVSDHSHHHGRDPHLWLNPENAVVLASVLADWLKEQLPEHSEQLEKAQARYQEVLLSLLENAKSQLLNSTSNPGPAVYHDGFGHLFQPLGIKQAAAITEVPEQQLGLQTLMKLKKGPRPACLLADAAELSLAQGYAEKLAWPLQAVDLMGAQATSYPEYYQGLVVALKGCLENKE
ncbi:zinc transport system substrate-binding protein [Alteromonadaceae bacterium Bs31]|nr:zinc transport system substrate-binding protein [Alteromonadaceae bacterium Bs31]